VTRGRLLGRRRYLEAQSEAGDGEQETGNSLIMAAIEELRERENVRGVRERDRER